MKPFGVRVVTVITGSIKTNVFVNAPEHQLPPDSRYAFAAKSIADRAAGKDVAQQEPPEKFAHRLVGDILGGVSGRIYRGKLASVVRYLLFYLPTTILVN
jgi:1-acylglycerone phosphate reductase